MKNNQFFRLVLNSQPRIKYG